MRKLEFAFAIVVAGILLQTLFFKFTGAPESVWIFSQLGVEPYGRIFTGVFELIASVLILVPATRAIGAVSALGLMSGAILSHLFILGVAVQGDGGLLFGLAVLVSLLSGIVLVMRRSDLLKLFRSISPTASAAAILVCSLSLSAAEMAKPINTLGESKGFFSDPKPTGVAIRGYDSVAYFTEKKPVMGKEQFSTDWKGAKWHFSSQANLEAFKANPEKYAPQYGGYCAYGVTRGYLVKVEPDQFAVVNDKLYLNYDAGVQKTWSKDQAKYIKEADSKFASLLK